MKSQTVNNLATQKLLMLYKLFHSVEPFVVHVVALDMNLNEVLQLKS